MGKESYLRKTIATISVNGIAECYVVNDVEIVDENALVSNILGLLCCGGSYLNAKILVSASHLSIIHQPRR